MSGLKILGLCFASLWLLCQVLLAQNAVAQTSAAELKQKKELLDKSIEYAGVLINDTRQKKAAGLEELSLLQTKIDARRGIVDTWRTLHDQLFDTIAQNLMAIDSLDTQLSHLKTAYATMIRSAYLNHNSHQRTLYLLAADGFSQAINRMSYYRSYAAKRHKQADEIALTQQRFIEKAMQTEGKINDNARVLQQLEQEYAMMEQEVMEKKSMVAQLQRNEQQLIRRQRHHQADAAALHRSILETFANSSQNGDQQSEQLLQTPAPATELLPASFASQRGKLPWPVATGFIIQPFGEHQHPDLKNIMIKNDGVDFLTQSNATAHAVFDGRVTRVMQAANKTWVVIVRHDGFLTVYANLARVFVTAGQRVAALQNLGLIYTDKDNARTLLHFEVWEGKTLTDPMQWLVSGEKVTLSGIQPLQR
ncbi:MAG: peptidoglycan DD-metalloendopeptidase family protein [Bacteroidales bacterium]|nr:peptidoglycan DD-metalloendopeptidase family protein [Bacteroidales bacterium]